METLYDDRIKLNKTISMLYCQLGSYLKEKELNGVVRLIEDDIIEIRTEKEYSKKDLEDICNEFLLDCLTAEYRKQTIPTKNIYSIYKLQKTEQNDWMEDLL